MTLTPWMRSSVFQFLLGTLKTRNQNEKIMTAVVSIPFRYAENYFRVGIFVRRESSFNSFRYAETYGDEEYVIFRPFQFLLGTLKTYHIL